MKKSIEQRIKEIESYYRNPPGTQLVRVLAQDVGVEWGLWMGQMSNPHKAISVRGKTITECLTKAEKQIEEMKEWEKK